ncbi:hypothetical protein ACIQVL_47085 [Streptomyces sp. NPDC090499]|uniref:hypothetical protein n=1 Tax=Streptomyces sp. NPDC090499 TaxID=3365965 RepID=UPI0037F1865F
MTSLGGAEARISSRVSPPHSLQRRMSVSGVNCRVKKARAQEGGPGALPAGQGVDDRDEELRRLRKLTSEQAKTIEILKKATAFFAKDSDR